MRTVASGRRDPHLSTQRRHDRVSCVKNRLHRGKSRNQRPVYRLLIEIREDGGSQRSKVNREVHRAISKTV